jgi:glucan endo-1,3-alpha-glucosidase
VTDSWNKNWIFKSDDFLFAKRWQTLVDNRDRFDSIEALTWNDYGESSYIGPIQGDQPNSQAWVDGFDHTALLAINKYYATAFKTGSYPAITKDVIYLSARPHTKTATATADSVGRPTGGQNGDPSGYLWTPDEFWALVFASKAGEVTLTSGANTKTVAVTAGVNWLSQTLEVGTGMSATFNGVSCSPAFTCECKRAPSPLVGQTD